MMPSRHRLEATIKHNWDTIAITVLIEIGCNKLLQQGPPPKVVLAALADLSAVTPDGFPDALERVRAAVAFKRKTTARRDKKIAELACRVSDAVSKVEVVMDERAAWRARMVHRAAELKRRHLKLALAAVSSCIPEVVRDELENVDLEALEKGELDGILKLLPDGAAAALREMVCME